MIILFPISPLVIEISFSFLAMNNVSSKMFIISKP